MQAGETGGDEETIIKIGSVIGGATVTGALDLDRPFSKVHLGESPVGVLLERGSDDNTSTRDNTLTRLVERGRIPPSRIGFTDIAGDISMGVSDLRAAVDRQGPAFKRRIAEKFEGTRKKDAVALARDVGILDLLRPLVIKTMRYSGSNKDQELISRFLQETQGHARINHHGVVRVLATGSEKVGGKSIGFMHLDYLKPPGFTLGTRPSNLRKMPWRPALQIYSQASDGLNHLVHDAGYLHGDLKHEHLYLGLGTEASEVKMDVPLKLLQAKGVVHEASGDSAILGWDEESYVTVPVTDGMAKVPIEIVIGDLGLIKSMNEERMARITGSGQFVGTVEFASADRTYAYPPTEHDDLYALGVVLYDLVTGGFPFGRERDQIAARVRSDRLDDNPPLASTENPQVPARVAVFIDRHLQRPATRRTVYDPGDPRGEEWRKAGLTLSTAERETQALLGGDVSTSNELTEEEKRKVNELRDRAVSLDNQLRELERQGLPPQDLEREQIKYHLEAMDALWGIGKILLPSTEEKPWHIEDGHTKAFYLEKAYRHYCMAIAPLKERHVTGLYDLMSRGLDSTVLGRITGQMVRARHISETRGSGAAHKAQAVRLVEVFLSQFPYWKDSHKFREEIIKEAGEYTLDTKARKTLNDWFVEEGSIMDMNAYIDNHVGEHGYRDLLEAFNISLADTTNIRDQGAYDALVKILMDDNAMKAEKAKFRESAGQQFYDTLIEKAREYAKAIRLEKGLELLNELDVELARENQYDIMRLNPNMPTKDIAVGGKASSSNMMSMKPSERRATTYASKAHTLVASALENSMRDLITDYEPVIGMLEAGTSITTRRKPLVGEYGEITAFHNVLQEHLIASEQFTQLQKTKERMDVLHRYVEECNDMLAEKERLESGDVSEEQQMLQKIQTALTDAELKFKESQPAVYALFDSLSKLQPEQGAAANGKAPRGFLTPEQRNTIGSLLPTFQCYPATQDEQDMEILYDHLIGAVPTHVWDAAKADGTVRVSKEEQVAVKYARAVRHSQTAFEDLKGLKAREAKLKKTMADAMSNLPGLQEAVPVMRDTIREIYRAIKSPSTPQKDIFLKLSGYYEQLGAKDEALAYAERARAL
jgi:serine/threonine protein kinase